MEWALIGSLLPLEVGSGCRPAGGDRPDHEDMVLMVRIGAQWRSAITVTLVCEVPTISNERAFQTGKGDLPFLKEPGSSTNSS